MQADAPPSPALSLVIPAYNEQRRLPETLQMLREFLARHALSCEVIVVDNASTDETAAVVQGAMHMFQHLRLLRTEGRGKGLAVKTGMLAARGSVAAFGDADLSWSLDELLRFPDLLSDDTPVVIGSREGAGALRVGEPSYRHLMGRVFNRVVQLSAVPGIEDTQCGFKVFRADAAYQIFSRQTLSGFGFDVEILFIAHLLGYGIKVVPLTWRVKDDSSVHPVGDTLAMLRDLAVVRLNFWRRRYGRPPAQAPSPSS